MRSKAGMKFDCIFEEPLDFIDIDYTHLNKTVRYEQRSHGEWIDEGVYADNAGQHVYRCTYCEDHIVEYPSELGAYCKYCGSDNRKREGEKK